jgi:superfamily II RNA helicase
LQENTLSIDLHQLFPFQLDDFQLEAIDHLNDGKSVVVCAPTGSGKTVIAEYAVELAMRKGKRCFYTTPLKALSNQKLYDLRKKYGEENVGLLTGDISVNRDAPVVVMTTEVFRNMLYGTSFGDVNKNLRNVAYVILDECHYMNDAERGTVWEESIIYSPEDIQLVALSATVANAEELTAWIDQTHGPTDLVQSDFRPVPLRFYYFGNDKLFPLLNQSKVINTQVRVLFGKQQKFNRNRRRPRMADVPDPRIVLTELAQRNMLPAIYFLFSRRGCEEAMRKTRGANLLTAEEKEILSRQIKDLIKDNPNLETHPHLPALYDGLSVHHAGMLPSWKGVVEKLFQQGLLKVVFATETLAAGINMPARTTIISAISKRTDDGHRNLTASEFLQMSGRAGRRGMDDLGHVVVLNHPFESVEDASKLATAPPDPLSSRFTPSYGMVLNLLQRHTMEEARDLIERSFGQFVTQHKLDPWFLQKMAWEQELDRLSRPLCPGELGDLPVYRRKLDAHHAKTKQARLTERGLQGRGKGNESYGEDVLLALRNEAKDILRDAHAMPCHGCPEQKPCSKQSERVKHLEQKLKELNRRIEIETTRTWRTFVALTDVLRLQGYLEGQTPTHLGQMAAAIRGTNELFLSEVAISGLFKGLRPAEFAAVLTALVSEESRIENAVSVKYSPSVDMVLEKLIRLGRKIFRLQRDFDIEIPIEFAPTFSGLSQMWAEGANWEDIRHSTQFDEGDVVRALRRTVDLCRQYMRAPNVPEDVVNLCMKTEPLLARDEVKEAF